MVERSQPINTELLQDKLEFAEFEWNRATEGMKERDAIIESLRGALEEINSNIKPELCSSELDLIAWWGKQVTRLQAIARAALKEIPK